MEMDFEKFDYFDYMGIESSDELGEDAKYSKKISIPQYLPSFEKPNRKALMNAEKFLQLKSEIVKSDISEEEKTFLIMAATRHIVFNYSLIADYYAHSNKEMQKLMEDSALVIIDFDDAIANGYVKLSKNIEQIMNKSGRKANDGE